jgi:hypothetical protein
VRISCPICKKIIEDAAEDFEFRPFCSARCRLVDLSNWLDERYRVPSPMDDEDQVN